MRYQSQYVLFLCQILCQRHLRMSFKVFCFITAKHHAQSVKMALAGVDRRFDTKNTFGECALKGVQRPGAFEIVCFCFCEFRIVRYSRSCGEHFPQSMPVFVLPLTLLIPGFLDPCSSGGGASVKSPILQI